MSSEEQDRIEAMLREPADRLPPPDGAWTRVRRRAWRRKWAKAGIVVAAGLVITAGAVPAALAVRHTSNDQTLQVTNTPTPGLGHHSTLFRPAPPSPSSTPTTARNGQPLAGFTPISVSFVSQTVGWVWGSAGPAGPGVIAATTDGGHTWVRRPAPPVTATDVAGSGDSGIRYANGQVGYVFGADTFMTLDAGLHWQRIRMPGRVVDLEAMNGRVWALIDTCSGCGSLRLYTAPDAVSVFTAATPEVPPLTGVRPASADNPGTIAVNGTAVYAMAGGALWFSPDSIHWYRMPMPCPGADRTNETISAWSPDGVVAVCGGQPSAGSEPKTAYKSTDHGQSWTELAAPPATGYPAAVSAGTADDILLGTTHEAGGSVTNNAGHTWTPTRTRAAHLSFVGFISTTHVVGLADPSDRSRAFLSSNDAGHTWTLTTFPP